MTEVKATNEVILEELLKVKSKVDSIDTRLINVENDVKDVKVRVKQINEDVLANREILQQQGAVISVNHERRLLAIEGKLFNS